MEPNESDRSWLAYVSTGMGGGTWARGKDRDKQIRAVARQFKSDWKHLFNLPKGQIVKIAVVDVTGRDGVYWDDFGFYDKETREEIPLQAVVNYPLP